MQITRNGIETNVGPGDWFTGAVRRHDGNAIRLVASEREQRPLHTGRTDGVAYPSQRPDALRHGRRRTGTVTWRADRGDPPRRPCLLRAGGYHWHGAAPSRFMTHVAMLQVDGDGNSATWGAHVTDEEYGAAPAIES
jgi:hypothetical protein